MLTVLRNFMRPKKEKALHDLNLGQIENIVQSYGQCMVSNPNNNILRSTKELPYPKKIIKSALLMAIKLTEDRQIKEQLKSGYLMLADFQDDLNDKTMPNFTDNGDSNATKTIANQYLVHFEKIRPSMEKSKLELEELISDLKNL